MKQIKAWAVMIEESDSPPQLYGWEKDFPLVYSNKRAAKQLIEIEMATEEWQAHWVARPVRVTITVEVEE